MPKVRTYSEQDKVVALVFFERLGDIGEAARRAKVEPAALKAWIAGAAAAHPAADLASAALLAAKEGFSELGDDEEDDFADEDEGDEDDVDEALGGRPMPEDALIGEERWPILCDPAHDLTEWVREHFIEQGGALYNPDHRHLRHASLGFVWMNALNEKGGKFIGGKAKLTGLLTGDKWAVACEQYQLIRWFGRVPDFTIYLDAPYCYEAPDRTFGALVDHELYHCAQKKDKFGSPKFDQEGNPVWCIRPHDAEEFVGVARRFGVGACAAGVADLVWAANQPPELAEVDIRAACGT